MMHRSVATAPGKAILFGEHAVVYGTTAVAAALSDLRISVDILCTDCATNDARSLVVTFEDIMRESDNTPSVVTVAFKTIKEKFSRHADPFHVLNPDETAKVALANLFEDERIEVGNAMMSVVYIVGKVLSRLVYDEGSVGLVMNVKSLGLPIGAGLGSSASFSVAVAASCLRLQALLYPDYNSTSSEAGLSNSSILQLVPSSTAPVSPDSVVLGVVNGWAFASEILLHGCPSGLDNTTSCYGGLVRFSRKGGEQFENISGVPPLHILLVNTKVPRSTKALVAGVRVLRDAHPAVVDIMLDAMNKIALDFLAMVEELKGDAETQMQDSDKYNALVNQTGDLMTMNHHLLCGVGVGHPALTAVVEAAAAATTTKKSSSSSGSSSSSSSSSSSGFAAKLTGAGGGGCAIVLSPIPYSEPLSGDAVSSSELESSLHTLVGTIRSLGCDVHHSSIAGQGVLWV